MTAGQVVVLVYLAALLSVPLVAGCAIRRRGGGRRAQVLALLAIVAAGVAFGAWTISTKAAEVSESQALGGGVRATLLLVVLPATLYLQLGYRVRSWIVIAVVWISALMPMGIYLLIAGLSVLMSLECPSTETCGLFS